eukprot:jgi/Ulvmu1/8373/UM042_0079.1
MHRAAAAVLARIGFMGVTRGCEAAVQADRNLVPIDMLVLRSLVLPVVVLVWAAEVLLDPLLGSMEGFPETMPQDWVCWHHQRFEDESWLCNAYKLAQLVLLW